jgi:hypothetical protein
MPRLNPDEPVGAKRKSRFIGELKIEYLWMSLAQRRRLRRVSLRPFYTAFHNNVPKCGGAA